MTEASGGGRYSWLGGAMCSAFGDKYSLKGGATVLIGGT